MPADTRPSRAKACGRSLLGALVPSLLMILAACLYVRHADRARANRPSGSAFRQYLADPGSRLVVYSPEIALAGEARGRVVRRQLALLRAKFDGLVLYRCDDETASLLDAAASLGYRAALLTVWDPNSTAEVSTAARLVDRFQGRLALAVSVGSEGLMDGRYTLDEMESAARDLRDRSGGPQAVEITTAEPWWLYLKHNDEAARLRNFGDFLSVNIHVVWDADIADPAVAADWTADRAIEVQQRTRKPLLVREAGFPGGGESPRATARFGFDRGMQTQFWTAWQLRSERGPLPPIAAFEAIDNPQKQWRSFEGQWGLLSTDLAPYPVWYAIPDLPPRSGVARF